MPAVAESLRPPRAISPDFQLRILPIFWWAYLVAFVVREYGVWRYVSRFVPENKPLLRILGFVQHSPKSFHVAFLIAIGVTFALWAGFRLVGAPLMRRWYNPRPLDPTHAHPLPFHLAAGEEPIAEYPARRMEGPTRHCGTFIQTTSRLWFFPFSWEQEPWSVPLDRLASAKIEPTVRRVLGLVRGYPDHVSLTDESGATFRLIVADPERVLRTIRS
jgi:hypothetical protein